MVLVSVKELKTHLSRYLHLAETGEPVVVTSHDTPVAKLVSLEREEPKVKKMSQLLGPSIEWNGKKPLGNIYMNNYNMIRIPE